MQNPPIIIYNWILRDASAKGPRHHLDFIENTNSLESKLRYRPFPRLKRTKNCPDVPSVSLSLTLNVCIIIVQVPPVRPRERWMKKNTWSTHKLGRTSTKLIDRPDGKLLRTLISSLIFDTVPWLLQGTRCARAVTSDKHTDSRKTMPRHWDLVYYINYQKIICSIYQNT